MSMTNPKQYALGVDPGYGGTGAVLRQVDEPEPIAWAMWESKKVNDWTTLRSMSIAVPLIETTLGWINEYGITELDFCIEYPVYNRNAGALMKQMSLYTMLQSYAWDYLRPNLTKLWLTEVNPNTSKSKLAHDGKAKKPAMIAASPWADYKKLGLTFEQAHTLADAYAHSLSAEVHEHTLHRLDQYCVHPTLTFPEIYNDTEDS